MPSPDTSSAFIFGCGYLGIRVARKLIQKGWSVSALTRRADRAAILAAEGIRPWIGDWNDGRTIGSLPPAARVLISVGYDPRSTRTRHEVYVDGLRRALRAIRPESRVCYVSTTGVFHHHDGRWVDESTPCHPTSEGGRAHLRAEELLRRVRHQQPSESTVVLRMAGLYGPDRVPRIAAIRRGEPIATQSDGFLNLIHVEDAAESVIRAWEHPQPKPLYLIADGRPILRGDYYREIARLTASPAPRFNERNSAAPISPGPASTARGDSSKRIWTGRMRRELPFRLKYPSYRDGLRSFLA